MRAELPGLLADLESWISWDVAWRQRYVVVTFSRVLATLDTGRVRDLDATSVLLTAGSPPASRRVTNIGRRAEYFSVRATGFGPHRVQVRPLAVRLAPGETARFTIRVSGPAGPRRLDDGYVVWRGARGGVTRIPVAITR